MAKVVSPLLEATNVHMQVSETLRKLSNPIDDTTTRKICFDDDIRRNERVAYLSRSTNVRRSASANTLVMMGGRAIRNSPPEKRHMTGNGILKRSESDTPNAFADFPLDNENIPLTLDGSTLPESSSQRESRKHHWKTVQAASALLHLQKHASTYGLKNHSTARSISSAKNETPKKEYGETTPEFLSWKRLHISRAQLKAVSNSSGILAGFAMTGLVEVNLNNDVPENIMLPYSIVSSILISVHLLALMISICVLPKIDAVDNANHIGLVYESPHDELKGYIALAWMCSTVIGLTLFLVEICLMTWVQLYSYSITSAICVTALIIPIMFVFLAIALNFWQKLAIHTYNVRLHGLEELESLRSELEAPEREPPIRESYYVNPAFVI